MVPESFGKRTFSRDVHRAIVITILITLGVAGLSLVVLSPLALQELGTISGLNWSKLSNIGQAYGAPATLLNVLVLGGVVAALFVQIRDSRTAREQTARTFHLELLRMAMGDADLMHVMGATVDDPKLENQNVYANLWMAYWQAMYRMNYLNEVQLRMMLSGELFQNAPGRQMWERGRDYYFVGATDRRSREFFRLVDDEYQKLAPLDPQTGSNSTGRRPWLEHVTSKRCLVATLIAATTGAAWGRSHMKRHGRKRTRGLLR